MQPPSRRGEGDSRWGVADVEAGRKAAPQQSVDETPSIRRAAVTGDAARWLFVAAFGLIGPIAFQAPKGLLSVVLPLAALSLLWSAWRARRLRLGAMFLVAWPLWVLVGVALASAAWSLDPEQTLSRAVRFVGEVLLGTMLLAHLRAVDAPWRRRALLAAGLGLALAALLALIDMASGFVIPDWLGREVGDPRFEQRPRLYYTWGAVIVAILLLPCVAALARIAGRAPAVLLGVLGIGTVLALASLTAKVALAGALAAFACVFAWRRSRWLLGAGMLAVLVALPVAFPVSPGTVCAAFGAGNSSGHRLMIYNAADGQIAQRPLLGWGADTSSAAMESRRLTRWPACAQFAPNTAVELPLHPHNLPLQVRLELGLPGIAAAALLLLVVMRAVSRPGLDRAASAAGWGALVAVFIESLVGFGIWQGWLIAAHFLAAAVVGLLLLDPSRPLKEPSAGAGVRDAADPGRYDARRGGRQADGAAERGE